MQKFSEVTSLLFEMTVEMTFENFYLRRGAEDGRARKEYAQCSSLNCRNSQTSARYEGYDTRSPYSSLLRISVKECPRCTSLEDRNSQKSAYRDCL